MITVKIAYLAKNLQTIRVKENSTVALVLEKLDIQPSGDIFVNGKRAGKTTKLRNGDIIGIVGNVEGGN